MEKLYKRILVSFMMVMMAVSFSACGDDDDEPGNNSTVSVVGTWYQENQSGTSITITFQANKKGNVKYVYTSGSDMTEYFEYSISTDRDGYTTLFITSDDCQLQGDYEVKMTPSTLTLIGYANGNYGTYQFKKK